MVECQSNEYDPYLQHDEPSRRRGGDARSDRPRRPRASPRAAVRGRHARGDRPGRGRLAPDGVEPLRIQGGRRHRIGPHPLGADGRGAQRGRGGRHEERGARARRRVRAVGRRELPVGRHLGTARPARVHARGRTGLAPSLARGPVRRPTPDRGGCARAHARRGLRRDRRVHVEAPAARPAPVPDRDRTCDRRHGVVRARTQNDIDQTTSSQTTSTQTKSRRRAGKSR